ncbi:MAG: diguanylate cyclase, partial [Planctomycetes bacterium]|nr:diguanylate cyclase [Planctomycetota bacterium]
MINVFQSIKCKLIFFSLCISLIPIAVITTTYYFNARSLLTRHELDEMVSIVESKKCHVLSFLEARSGRVIDFSSDGFIKDGLETIARGGVHKDEAIIALSRHLSTNKKPLDHYIVAIAVVDKDGKVVASTKEAIIGVDVSGREPFLEARKKSPTQAYISQPCYDPYLDANCMFIAAPIISRNSNEPIGVIINAYNPAILNGITIDSSSRSKAWEVYLVNRDKIMLTESQFIEGAPFKQVVDTEPVRKIAEEGKEMVGVYRDYRGVSVVGASAYLPEYGWTLLTEIDEAEAFARLKTLGIVALITGLISIVAVAGVGITFATSVSRPIKKLTYATKRLADGDLSYRAELARKDEIGLLADSFDSMADKLSKEIAGHMQAREALRKSEASLAHAQRIAHLGNWGWDVIENEVHWSDEVYRIFGLIPQNFGATYEAFLHSVHPDDREFVKKSLTVALQEKILREKEYRIVLPNSSVRVVYTQGEVVSDSTGRVIQVRGTIQDITERKRIEEELKSAMEERDRKIEELKHLMEFSDLMRDECQEEALIEHMATVLKERFHPDFMTVLMVDKEKNMIIAPVIYPPMPVDKFIRRETVLDPSQCRVMRTGHGVVVKDINTEPACECLRYEMNEGGYACLPLFTGEATVGTVLTIKKEKGYWDNEETNRLLSTYIGLASSALDNVRLINLTKQAAITDALTGIYNRRFFAETLEKQMSFAKRHMEPMSLLIADLDHFKNLNDTYGHTAGDRALQQVSVILKDSIRTSDVLCRYGGEEFAIIMPKTGISGALEKAEKIRQYTESARFDTMVTGKSLGITISIGVASFPENGTE